MAELRYPAGPTDPRQEELLRRIKERDAAAATQGGIAGLYAPAINTAVQRKLEMPDPEPEPSWSTLALTKAFGGGLVSGGLEYSGSVADLASGAAAPLAATGGSAGGMFAPPSDDERRQQDEARQRMLNGPAFDTKMGNVLRAKAGEFAPDPITSHRSAQVLHGLVSGLSKAAVSAATLGPLPGAAAFGLEEGNTTTQNLIASGIDTDTAVKVGAITGIASGVGAALPVAGNTLTKTLGLVAVGGPGTYAAQEALSKNILQEAGYTAQAEMHDPLDPVMLALSTVIPGVFGGFALRQAARARAAADAPVRTPPEPSPPQDASTPKAEPAAARAPSEEAAAVVARDLEAVDAARVRALDEAEAKHVPPDAPAGNERGIDAVREAVESGDMAPALRMVGEQEARAPRAVDTPAFKEWFGDSRVVDAQGEPLVMYHGTAGDFDKFRPSARGAVFVTRDADWAAMYADAAARAGEGNSNVLPVYVKASKIFDGSDTKSIEALRDRLSSIDSNIDVARLKSGDWQYLESTGVQSAIQSMGFDAMVVREGGRDGIAVFNRGNLKSAIGNSGRFDPQSGSLTDQGSAPMSRAEADPMPGQKPGDGATDQPTQAAQTPEATAAADSQAVAELEKLSPDMMITLPGSEAPIRLADALEQIKMQADEIRQDGDLFKAAAQCALLSGA